jgi:hypothetical protein
MITNYVKLYVRTLKPTTYLFTFGDKGKAALKAAQAQRTKLRRENPTLSAEAFQLSTFAPSALRGVPVVGEPIRSLAIVEAA